jgi:putative bacteriocin precursor
MKKLKKNKLIVENSILAYSCVCFCGCGCTCTGTHGFSNVSSGVGHGAYTGDRMSSGGIGDPWSQDL